MSTLVTTALRHNASASNNMVLDSNGNVGVGTVPGNRFHISSPLTGTTTRSNAVLRVQSEATGRDVHIQLSDNITNSAEIGMVGGPMYFATAGVERMRIDSVGRVTKPFTPAFLASNNSGTITVNIGSYFPFNVLHTAFAGSNRNSGYNTSTFVYTAPVAGLYQFYTQFYLTPTTQNVSISWWRNGTQMTWSDVALATFVAAPGTIVLSGSVIMELSANDFVGVQPRTGGANISVYGGHSVFWGYLIG